MDNLSVSAIDSAADIQPGDRAEESGILSAAMPTLTGVLNTTPKPIPHKDHALRKQATPTMDLVHDKLSDSPRIKKRHISKNRTSNKNQSPNAKKQRLNEENVPDSIKLTIQNNKVLNMDIDSSFDNKSSVSQRDNGEKIHFTATQIIFLSGLIFFILILGFKLVQHQPPPPHRRLPNTPIITKPHIHKPPTPPP